MLGQEICFRSSQYDDLFELFHSRQRMHRKVRAGDGEWKEQKEEGEGRERGSACTAR